MGILSTTVDTDLIYRLGDKWEFHNVRTHLVDLRKVRDFCGASSCDSHTKELVCKYVIQYLSEMWVKNGEDMQQLLTGVTHLVHKFSRNKHNNGLAVYYKMVVQYHCNDSDTHEKITVRVMDFQQSSAEYAFNFEMIRKQAGTHDFLPKDNIFNKKIFKIPANSTKYCN